MRGVPFLTVFLHHAVVSGDKVAGGRRHRGIRGLALIIIGALLLGALLLGVLPIGPTARRHPHAREDGAGAGALQLGASRPSYPRGLARRYSARA